jgi:hypothetical protein
MSKAKNVSAAARESANLLSSEVPIERKKVLDVLKTYALLGEEVFESYVSATETLLAEAVGHPEAGRISLARMQKEKVRGASTFYTYVTGLRKLIATGNEEAIKSATATWLTSKSPHALPTAISQAVSAVKSLHLSGKLSKADYNILSAIAKQGQPSPLR